MKRMCEKGWRRSTTLLGKVDTPCSARRRKTMASAGSFFNSAADADGCSPYDGRYPLVSGNIPLEHIAWQEPACSTPLKP